MNIITVIPIQKGIRKTTLSYFTKEDVRLGAMVKIPLRSGTTYGLTVDTRPVSDAKSEIKSLSYSIRKIEKVSAHAFLTAGFMNAVSAIADYYADSVGSILSTLIPKTIVESSGELSFEPRSELPETFYETSLLQADDDERFATYKSFIREEFARGKSVLCILPTTEHIQNAEESLHKGIEQYTYVLHSALSKKELIGRWKKVVNEMHPVLIIATGQFLSLPREDIGTIIVEKENSRSYNTQSRPFLDIRVVARLIAQKTGKRLILGDSFLRIETIWEAKQGLASEFSQLKFRLLSRASCELVDVRKEKSDGKKEFTLWSNELLTTLETAKENNERTVIFCARKGLAPTTVCSDCGTLVHCNNCKAPVVLYSKIVSGQKKNLFVCHHCGERRDADLLCTHCNGWRLTPLGVGIDKVHSELCDMYPERTIVVMDSEHIKTHKQAMAARDAFYAHPGSILVCTEMAFPYLREHIENTAIVTLDALFGIPDFRIGEKVFNILLFLRSLAEHTMIVQTREPERHIFDYALRGNLIDFYREEIEERKLIGYPPFATYIKLTLTGEKAAVTKEMKAVAESLLPYELTVFEAWKPGGQKEHVIHGLITLPKGTWVDTALLQKLRGLSPAVSIKIDPDTLL